MSSHERNSEMSLQSVDISRDSFNSSAAYTSSSRPVSTASNLSAYKSNSIGPAYENSFEESNSKSSNNESVKTAPVKPSGLLMTIRQVCCCCSNAQSDVVNSNKNAYKMKDVRSMRMTEHERIYSVDVDISVMSSEIINDVCNDKDVEEEPVHNNQRQSTSDIPDNISLELLCQSPIFMDERLNISIKTLEHSLKDYNDLEEQTLEDIDSELKTLLKELRNDPDAFINSSNPKMRELAVRRTQLLESSFGIAEGNGFSHTDSTLLKKNRRSSLAMGVRNKVPSEGNSRTSLRRVSLPSLQSRSSTSSVDYTNTNQDKLVIKSRTSNMTSLQDPNTSEGNRAPSFINRNTDGSIAASSNSATDSYVNLNPSDGIGQSNPMHSISSPDSEPNQRLGATHGNSPSINTYRDSDRDGNVVSPHNVETHISKENFDEDPNTLAHQMSVRWAGRLAEMTPTQGKLAKRETNSKDTLLSKIRPKWPEWLVDLSFNVIKTNPYGKRQHRVLSLREFHIWNIKNGTKITWAYTYSQVTSCYLINDKCFVLEVNDENNNTNTYFYESILAAHIVQQIITRVQVRRALDLASANLDKELSTKQNSNNSIGYSVRATSAMINKIIAANSSDNSSNILSFAQILGEKAVARTSTQLTKEISRNDGMLSESEKLQRRTKLLQRLVSINPGSAEYGVLVEMQKKINSSSSPEGNTTSHFIRNFPIMPLDSNLVDFRHFIEGMQEYIMETHAEEYAALLRSGKNSIDYFDYGTTDDLTEEVMIALSYIAFNVVEETVFFALEDNIISYFLDSEDRKKAERHLARKMLYLSSRSQADWGIPDTFISPTSWNSAIFEINGVERNPTPSMRLNALVRSAKSIYTEYNTEKALQTLPGETVPVLGADDFLPIFIFVLCQSNLKHPNLNRDMLWSLCHPDQLHGESGYYLTAYESALSYIDNIDVDENALNQLEVDERNDDFYSKKAQLNPSTPPSIRTRIATKIRRMSVQVLHSPGVRNSSASRSISTDT